MKYKLFSPRSIPDIFPSFVAVNLLVSNSIAAKYLSVLVLETVTDLIVPLTPLEKLAKTFPSLGSFKLPSLIEQLSGKRIDGLECKIFEFWESSAFREKVFKRRFQILE